MGGRHWVSHTQYRDDGQATVALDYEEGLRALARKAVSNKSGRSKDGPVTVKILRKETRP